MKGIRHPITDALYEQDGEGNVRVALNDGRVGTFTPHGQRVSGDKIDVDIHLTGWVGGPKVKHHRLES
jgi:hypothetical protein